MTEGTAQLGQAVLTFAGNILVALITGGFAFYGVKKTADTNAIKMDMQIKEIQKDIKRLEEKQDKHNAVIERTYKLEQRVDDIAANLAAQ